MNRALKADEKDVASALSGAHAEVIVDDLDCLGVCQKRSQPIHPFPQLSTTNSPGFPQVSICFY